MTQNPTKPAPIRPIVCRMLWYYPSHDREPASFAFPTSGQPCAALITAVHDDHLVNVSVFDANGVQYPRQMVVLVQPGEQAPTHQHLVWPVKS
jgi:hypothetical protein